MKVLEFNLNYFFRKYFGRLFFDPKLMEVEQTIECIFWSIRKSVQKICNWFRIVQNHSENPSRKSVQKIRSENLYRKSVQKIRSENPFRKSVQKIRSESFRKLAFHSENGQFFWSIRKNSLFHLLLKLIRWSIPVCHNFLQRSKTDQSSTPLQGLSSCPCPVQALYPQAPEW